MKTRSFMEKFDKFWIGNNIRWRLMYHFLVNSKCSEWASKVETEDVFKVSKEKPTSKELKSFGPCSREIFSCGCCGKVIYTYLKKGER